MGIFQHAGGMGAMPGNPLDVGALAGLRWLLALRRRVAGTGARSPAEVRARPFRRTAVVSSRELPDGARLPLADVGGAATSYASLRAVDTVLSSTRQVIDSVLIDVDGCGGIAGLIDSLLQFRLKHPTVPLILASRDVQLDDLSVGRLPIADATVRLPLSRARAIEAKRAASENNDVWQHRIGTRPAKALAAQ